MQLHARIAGWSRELKAVYVYFNNDDSGYAPRNALKLKEQVVERLAGATLASPG